MSSSRIHQVLEPPMHYNIFRCFAAVLFYNWLLPCPQPPNLSAIGPISSRSVIPMPM